MLAGSSGTVSLVPDRSGRAGAEPRNVERKLRRRAMTRSLKRTALIAVAVLALLVGITVAVAMAAGGSGHPPRPRHSASARAARRAARPSHPASHATNPIATAARYLGIAPPRLRAQLRSGESLAQVAEATPGRSLSGLTAAVLAAREARLGTQLASGRLTEAQRQNRLSTLSQRVDEQLSRPGPATANTSLTWAARYLGASRHQLRVDVRSGESLAAVAEAEHKSTNGLIAAIVAAERARLEEHLAKGNISQAQEQNLLAGLTQRVTLAVQRTRAARR